MSFEMYRYEPHDVRTNDELRLALEGVNRQSFGDGDRDPFSLDESPLFTTHITAAWSRQVGYCGVASFTLRRSPQESHQLAQALSESGLDMRGSGYRMLLVDTVASRVAGGAARIMSDVCDQVGNPEVIVGYTRTGALMSALRAGLLPRGYHLYLGGVPIDPAEQTPPPFVYAYNCAVAEFMVTHTDLQQGSYEIPFDTGYKITAICYPGTLRTGFRNFGQVPEDPIRRRIWEIIDQTERCAGDHPEVPLTLLFHALRPSDFT